MNTKAVIILQRVNGSNQHTVHLELTQCCMSVISQVKTKHHSLKYTEENGPSRIKFPKNNPTGELQAHCIRP